MPAAVDLTLDQTNDETLAGTVTDQDTAIPHDLTGVTLEMLIKPASNTPDTDPGVTTLSTTGGQIVIGVPASGGTYNVTIPTAVTTTARQRWYRVDAIASGSRRTVVYGTLTIQDL